MAMEEAQNFEEVFPGVFRWEAFSPEHKVELTSHAVVLHRRIFCFDPICLTAGKLAALETRGRPEAIILTNGNHERYAANWSARWKVPIWAAETAGLRMAGLKLLPRGGASWKEAWELLSLEGGGPGETAFFCAELSLLVVGDAIVNLPYRGLEILPAKYCVNRSVLEANLKKVATYGFDKLCVAHGQSIQHGASGSLQALLG